MKLQAIRTHSVKAYESLTDLLDKYLPPLAEGTLIAITSKVISLCQGQVVSKDSIKNKEVLVKQEADAFLEDECNPYQMFITLKNNLLIPSAGIDESNGDGFYILYPKDVQKTAAMIWNHLRKKHQLKKLGVLITDSHTTPLRRGVTGICVGWCGFEPLYSYIGKPDIFGAPLRVTQINILDALAASAVFMMGEGSEQTPLITIQDAPRVQFVSTPPSQETEDSIRISLEEDIYAPLLQAAPWVFNSKKN